MQLAFKCSTFPTLIYMTKTSCVHCTVVGGIVRGCLSNTTNGQNEDLFWVNLQKGQLSEIYLPLYCRMRFYNIDDRNNTRIIIHA